jgi:hypothetical protein
MINFHHKAKQCGYQSIYLLAGYHVSQLSNFLDFNAKIDWWVAYNESRSIRFEYSSE